MKIGSKVKDQDGDTGIVTILEHDWIQVTYSDNTTFGWLPGELEQVGETK